MFISQLHGEDATINPKRSMRRDNFKVSLHCVSLAPDKKTVALFEEGA